MANEVRIRVTAEDHASAPIANVKASTIAAGAAMGTALANIGRDVAGLAKDAILSFAEVGSQIFDMAQKTGIGAEALSELKFAAEQSGSSLDAIGVAAKRMNTQLFELSAGSEPAKEAFAALGLGLENFLGKGVAENFDQVLTALADVGDKSAQSALAVKLFGKSGTDLLPILAGGVGGLEDMRNRAHELGVVFDAEAAAKADALGDSMDELNGRLRGVGFQLGEALGPALVQVATVMVNLVSVVGKNQYALAALGGVIGGGLLLAVVAFVASIGWIPIAITAVVAAVSAGVMFIVKHFDEIQEAWFHLWDAMPGPIKTVWEGIKSFLGMLMDGFRTSINFVIDLLNKIQVPDWVPLIGGKGINIPHIEDMAAAVGDLAMAGVGKAKGFVSGLGAALPSIGGGGVADAGLTDQVDSTTKATKELTEAEKALEEIRRETAQTIADINRQLVDEQITAFYEGGQAQLDAVKTTQAAMMEEVRARAVELQQKWGLEFPDALSRAFATVKAGIDAIAESARRLQQAGISYINGLSQQGVTGYAPGVFETIAGAFGLNTFASGGMVPGAGPQLAVVHGGERVLTPGQQGGVVMNITINAGAGADGASIGEQLAEYLNRAFLRNGPVLLPGSVAS